MDLRWWVAALLFAAVMALALGAAAFLVDGDGAGVNLLTEGAGVVVGTAFTVLLVDELRRRREGRDAETLQNNQLTAEIAHNLTRLVTRQGRGAIARHQLMGRLREEKPIRVDDIGQTVRLNDSQATSLVLAIAPIRPLGLRTDRVAASLSDGVYQSVNHDSVEDSQVHLALRRVLDDVERIESLVGTANKDEWLALLNSAAPISRPGGGSCDVRGESLLMAYAFHDLCENLLTEQVALLHYFLGTTPEYQAPERRPATPLGTDMEQALKAESVSPEEVVRLARGRIQPFGERPPAWVLGETRDAQLKQFEEVTREMIRRGYGLEIPDDRLAALGEFFDQTFASDDEGIGRVDHPRRP